MDLERLNIIEALKKTSKGQLQYDRDWYSRGRLKQMLNDCSSPPKLGTPLTQISAKEKEKEKAINLKNKQSENGRVSIITEPNDRAETNQLAGSGKSSPAHTASTVQSARYQKAISNVERDWSLKVKEAVERRKKLFEKHAVELEHAARDQLMELYLRREEEAAQVMMKTMAQDQARNEELQQKHLRQKERHRQHARLLDDQMQEAYRKQREEEELRKKRLEEARQRLHDMLQKQEQLHLARDGAVKMLDSCQFKEQLPEIVPKYLTLLERIWQTMEDIIKQAKQGEATPDHLQTVSRIWDQASNLVDHVRVQIEAVNKKGKEDAARQQAEQEKAAAAATAAAEAAAAAAAQAAGATSQTSVSASGDASAVATVSSQQPESKAPQFVAPDSLLQYVKLQEHLQATENGCQQLVSDPQFKKLRFELQKAVNTTVNAISPTSGSHLRDKLQRMCRLLSGKSLDVGGKMVCAASHPAGIAFCKQLFAKKIVKQGDEQVSSNHESAFAIAAVAVGVWCEFPDVGQLLLAGLHHVCPYLVPYYLPKKDGQSSEEYYKSLGYKYEDGTVEKQDKFLRRMSGLMWLYAAMVVSTPPQLQQQKLHPQGLDQGWLWLAHMLNLPPRPDITATMLHDFLQVTGHRFQAVYGKQFLKLLQVIHTDYMPRIKTVVPAGAGGPVTRLESFLDKCLRGQSIPRPSGLLSHNFWVS